MRVETFPEFSGRFRPLLESWFLISTDLISPMQCSGQGNFKPGAVATQLTKYKPSGGSKYTALD